MRVRLGTFDVDDGARESLGRLLNFKGMATRRQVRDYLSLGVRQELDELARQHAEIKAPSLPFCDEAAT